MAERDYIDELEEHSYKLWKLKVDLRKLVDRSEERERNYLNSGKDLYFALKDDLLAVLNKKGGTSNAK